MNSIDAAYKVLLEAGKPLHYAEIARLVVTGKLWQTSGKTPENTVNRDINQEIMHRGQLARFVRLGDGMYAAVPESATQSAQTTPPDLAFVSDAWGHLPIGAKQQILQIVRGALTGQTGEVDDPVIALVLPNGPKGFPKEFLDSEIVSIVAVELPEERLTFRKLPNGQCVVESHFGHRLDVRNETEGMFVVYAHGRGARTLKLPEQMLHLFKAVAGYKTYLRDLWQELYRAYGRECGDRSAAFSHTKTAFETLGLPQPDEAQTPPASQNIESTEKRTKLKRGLRTPETAFYAPILQALYESNGSAKTSDVVKRVGEIMTVIFSPDDHEPLPSTGISRWENTAQFARYSMVRAGFLESNTRRGIWTMSEKGLDEHIKLNKQTK